MVELDGTGAPAGGGPREPCAGPGSTGTPAVDVGDGEGVSLGDTVSLGETVAVGVGVAASCPNRPGELPRKTEVVNPRMSTSRITPTPPMRAPCTIPRLGPRLRAASGLASETDPAGAPAARRALSGSGGSGSTPSTSPGPPTSS